MVIDPSEELISKNYEKAKKSGFGVVFGRESHEKAKTCEKVEKFSFRKAKITSRARGAKKRDIFYAISIRCFSQFLTNLHNMASKSPSFDQIRKKFHLFRLMQTRNCTNKSLDRRLIDPKI